MPHALTSWVTEVDVAFARETGKATFLGLELLCHPKTFVPRAETELLARVAIEKVEALRREACVVDVCCGTGNIACAIATRLPTTRVWASDSSVDAVANARANVAHLALGPRVEVLHGDLLRALEGHRLERSIDLITCNPPYISTQRLEKDRRELLALEPREAFDGGPYGLTGHQRVINEGLLYLTAHGWLALEIGVGQARQVETLIRRAKGYDLLEHLVDETHEGRVVLARKAR